MGSSLKGATLEYLSKETRWKMVSSFKLLYTSLSCVSWLTSKMSSGKSVISRPPVKTDRSWNFHSYTFWERAADQSRNPPSAIIQTTVG